MHQNLDSGPIHQSVEKSSLQASSAWILTPRDFPLVRVPKRQNEASASRETRCMSGMDNSRQGVPGLSYDQEQQITKPLVPRRRRPQEKGYQTLNRSSTETSFQIRQLQQIMLQLQHDIALPDLTISSQGDLNPDLYQDVINETSTSTGTHRQMLPEGSYGMRVQQLEELMRDLREGTAHSELGLQDQVGTGHSETLAGLMEEILVLQRNQSRRGERSPLPHRNVVV
ncbi:hypothetical protein H2248_003980 [Termitomyces sp. 'cryptogamus']|nr:hypothetical protein H2248_003980 [Termitomyces sp. 'cryptogamus']